MLHDGHPPPPSAMTSSNPKESHMAFIPQSNADEAPEQTGSHLHVSGPVTGGHSTESFQSSTLSEAQQIVAVYALLERVGGVYGDGIVEGVELTRDGRASAFQSSSEARLHFEQRLHSARFGPQPDGSGHHKHAQHNDDSDVLQAREVDRYGFFVGSSGTAESSASNDARTWLLERSAYLSDKPVQSTSAIPQRASLEPAAHPTSREQMKPETRRMGKWQKMLEHAGPPGREKQWQFTANTLGSAGNQRRLRRRIYKGIPDRWRPAVWPLLATLTPDFQPMPASILNSDKDLGRGKRLSRADMATATVGHDTQIDLDIPRTLGSHTLFTTRYGKGQRMLFEVLHERSSSCRDCGYCQGMATIAAICVAYGSPPLFAMLHGPDSQADRANGHHQASSNTDFPPFDVAGKFRHHDMLRSGFPALQDCIEQQERLCSEWMPEVSAALANHGIPPSAYCTKWYITLFTSSTFTFEMQLRIWDAMLLEGRELLVVVSLAIIHGLRGVILSPKADFETILNALGGAFVVENPDAFMEWVRKKMSAWRKAVDAA